MSDKTEEPTPKRLRRAEEDGDSGVSTNAAQALAFVVGLSLLTAAVTVLVQVSSSSITNAIAKIPTLEANTIANTEEPIWNLVRTSVPILVVVAAVSATGQLLQTRGIIAAKRLVPDLTRLNPFAGMKQLFSPTRAFSVARALVAATVVGIALWISIRKHALDLAHVTGGIPRAFGLAGIVSLEILRTAAYIGLALGAIDIFITRKSWLKRLRMSKDEVKREYKESEGDPHLKAARERAHHEMLASIAVANVKNANVVIVNPTHIACALRYNDEDGDEAPTILARGEGDLAKRIVEAANAYGVPVVQNIPLARALVELQIGDVIPEALYEAVAEILREIWDEDSSSNSAAR